MSRVFEALRQHEQNSPAEEQTPQKAATATTPELLQNLESDLPNLSQAKSLRLYLSKESELVAVADPYSLAAEKFRLLALRIRHLQEKRPIRKLLVTSSVVQEGKSLISANLAFTMANRENQRVLLIEGDLRQPRIGEILRHRHLDGLSEWAAGSKPITDFLYRPDDLPLWFLPAGRNSQDPLETLQSPRLPELMAQLMDWFDIVIIDAPPVVPLADSHVWEAFVDSTLLVVREGRTPKKQLEKALEILDRKKIIGAVLNEATIAHKKYYGYYNQQPRPTPGSGSGSEQEK